MLSDRRPNASPLLFSIASSLQDFGRLALLRGTPMCFRQHLHPIPFRAQTSRHRHLFAGLFGCNRSRALLFICHFVNIHAFVSLCLCVHSRLLCRRAVSLCFLLVRNRSSLSSLLSPAFRFKTPVVPPRFSTHARSNATYLVNPT